MSLLKIKKLAVLVLIILLPTGSIAVKMYASAWQIRGSLPVISYNEVKHDISAPLINLLPKTSPKLKKFNKESSEEETESSSKKRLSAIFDPVVQTSPGQANVSDHQTTGFILY